MSRLVNCKELGKMLGLSNPTIAFWQRQGYIKHVAEGGIGRQKFFDVDEVMLVITAKDLKISPAAMARVAEFQSAPPETTDAN